MSALATNTLTYARVNDEVLKNLGLPKRGYFGLLGLFALGMLLGGVCWFVQILTGLGVAGMNVPVYWGTYLINFVFWVGIAHSGTLISAILFLFRAPFRTAVARSAEAMTVFAVMIAGLFPLIHMGRIWVFYWMIPYPNQRELWPNFQSPLIFDLVAISTYMTVSSLFWFTGMIPDLAAVRDAATGWKRRIYGLAALGWRNTHRNWLHHTRAYLLFASLATPLVISVHSVVSWDFALSIVPGMHSTIFAPYFVAGAIHSGLAMVITLLIPMRKVLSLESLIPMKVFESLAKLIILTGIIVGYAYGLEYFLAFFGGHETEIEVLLWRAVGPYAPWFWTMVACNALLPLLFFFKRVRTSIPWLLVICIGVNIGMWFERFMIIVGSPAHDYMPNAWGTYGPTLLEIGVLVGAFSMFFFLFFLFAKFLPVVSIAEVKENLPPGGQEGTDEV
jgi:molybdopterin-containing oxidoreductase family membrane subunit